jgi:hypothetical protein
MNRCSWGSLNVFGGVLGPPYLSELIHIDKTWIKH